MILQSSYGSELPEAKVPDNGEARDTSGIVVETESARGALRDTVVESASGAVRDTILSPSSGATLGDTVSSPIAGGSGVGIRSKSSRPAVPVEPPYRVVLRSLVYPGWGQLYNGKYMKALVVSASEATLLCMIYTESRKATKAYDAHLAAPNLAKSEILYSEYTKHFDRRDALVWWTSGLVLLSLADAYVDAHLLTFDEEFGDSPEAKSISFTTGGLSRGGFVGVRYVF